MNYYKQFASSSFAAAIIALSAAPAMAQSTLDIRQTATEINAANTLLRDGKVDEALAAYRKIVPAEQQRDELNYNMAVAEYRNGNIEAAEKLFTDVVGTDSPTIAADSRYNLGNCQYAGALKMAEQDKPAAIELLRKAIANYRGALRGKPNNPDARANIELAGELIRTLEQEQKKEDQQQNQDDQQQNEDKQQDQQNKDQQKQDDQKQQEKSQDSESEKDESQKDSDQQKSDSQDSKSDQEKSDQQKNEEQMDQEQKKQDEQSAADQPQENEQKNDEQKENKAGDKEKENDQQKPSEKQSQSKSSESRQKQQQKSGGQEKPEDEGTPEEQDEKHEPVPTGDLKPASEQEQSKQPEGAVGTADQNGKDGLMTREEALKMLQSVRDRDMLRRMQQQRQERSRRVRVDKDW